MKDKKNIKYYRQETSYSCGPACLRMVLSLFDVVMNEPELIDLCETDLFGTTCEQIIEAAKKLGFHAEKFKETSKINTTKLLSAKLPLIALVDASKLYGGIPLGHFVVIVRIENSTIIYHDPIIGEKLTVDLVDFLDAWENCSFRGVSIWR